MTAGSELNTAMNIYRDVATSDMREASGRVAMHALDGREGPYPDEKMVGAIGFEPMTSTV